MGLLRDEHPISAVFTGYDPEESRPKRVFAFAFELLMFAATCALEIRLSYPDPGCADQETANACLKYVNPTNRHKMCHWHDDAGTCTYNAPKASYNSLDRVVLLALLLAILNPITAVFEWAYDVCVHHWGEFFDAATDDPDGGAGDGDGGGPSLSLIHI